jgi:hypothetical protein
MFKKANPGDDCQIKLDELYEMVKQELALKISID